MIQNETDAKKPVKDSIVKRATMFLCMPKYKA